MSGVDSRPATELMLTMRPPPRSRMPGSTSRAMRTGAEHVGLELRPGQLVADVLDRAALRRSRRC
jgi:hypothetical protein